MDDVSLFFKALSSCGCQYSPLSRATPSTFLLLVSLRFPNIFHWSVPELSPCSSLFYLNLLSWWSSFPRLYVPSIYMASIPYFTALVLISLPNCSIVYLTDRYFSFNLKLNSWSLNQLKWCQIYLSICSVQKLRITLNFSFLFTLYL